MTRVSSGSAAPRLSAAVCAVRCVGYGCTDCVREKGEYGFDGSVIHRRLTVVRLMLAGEGQSAESSEASRTASTAEHSYQSQYTVAATERLLAGGGGRQSQQLAEELEQALHHLLVQLAHDFETPIALTGVKRRFTQSTASAKDGQ